MIRVRLPVLLLCAALLQMQARAANPTVFGVNEQLADGAVAIRSGRHAEGVRLTHLGLAFEVLKRQRAAAHSNLCAGYTGMKEYSEAIRQCNIALALEARRWQAYNNRALAYLGLGELDLASQDADSGLAINPDSTTLHRVRQLVDIQLAQPRSAPGKEKFR